MADLPVCLVQAAFVLLLFVGGAEAGEFCYENHYTKVTYCDYGCCGPAYDQSCCDWSPTTALIIGCVFAGLFVISVIVVVVCCLIKKKAHTGKIVSPAPGSLQRRPGAGTSSATAPPATVTTTTTTPATYPTVYHMNPYPGTGVYQTQPGYQPHYLPPLTQPPAYQPTAPPPAYDIGLYTTAAMQQPPLPPLPQQQQQQQQQPATYSYGQGGGGGGGGGSSSGVPTTAYGNNFVV